VIDVLATAERVVLGHGAVIVTTYRG
jgi:hypothetical protein